MNLQTIILKEVDFKNVPGLGGLQLWNPSFRNMTIEQLSKETREYSDVYNFGVFCRQTGSIHLYFTEPCEHRQTTFNNDAGVNVCDNCNNRI